jgi:nitrate reductase gamma subunit
MHSLIYTAILMRCLLGIVTAVLFAINPNGEWAMALIDKNHPFTAFANDFLGVLILVGILWALTRRFITKPGHVVSEYQDNIALGLIGSLIVLGFFLEGVRIVVTAVPVELAMASFMGYPLSRIFALLDLPWASIYPLLWYAHGIVAAVFVAYLPFGKMRHMFNTPLTYILEEVSGVKNEKRI